MVTVERIKHEAKKLKKSLHRGDSAAMARFLKHTRQFVPGAEVKHYQCLDAVSVEHGYDDYAHARRELGPFYVYHKDYGYASAHKGFHNRAIIDGTRWVGDGTEAYAFETQREAYAFIRKLVNEKNQYSITDMKLVYGDGTTVTCNHHWSVSHSNGSMMCMNCFKTVMKDEDRGLWAAYS